MAFFISNLLSESIFDFGKWSNGKSAYTRICGFFVWPLPKVENLFRKANLKWKTPYFYSTFFVEEFLSIFLKNPKIDFPLYFQKVIRPG